MLTKNANKKLFALSQGFLTKTLFIFQKLGTPFKGELEV